MSEYAHPEILVSTEWVEAHAGDPKIRVVEVDVDTKAYEEAHVENAVGWNWQSQLCDTVRRDVIPKADLEKLLGETGITPETTIVLYGDNNNWFACWAFWQLRMYGHSNLRLMNGGRKKWLSEGRVLTAQMPSFKPTLYKAMVPDASMRAFLPQVMDIVRADGPWALVDVRSPDEFSGKILCPPGLPETCQRGGHIPGAFSVPWGKNVNEDGTFKTADELEALYHPLGLTPDKGVVTYCRIGERSSLSWVVLKFLLGHDKVMNYDGSWTEWGNLVNAPVERGAHAI
ncbi:MAG: sulfurtransferase [Candidatus Hydrogenedentota bacterium]